MLYMNNTYYFVRWIWRNDMQHRIMDVREYDGSYYLVIDILGQNGLVNIKDILFEHNISNKFTVRNNYEFDLDKWNAKIESNDIVVTHKYLENYDCARIIPANGRWVDFAGRGTNVHMGNILFEMNVYRDSQLTKFYKFPNHGIVWTDIKQHFLLCSLIYVITDVQKLIQLHYLSVVNDKLPHISKLF